MDAHFKQFLEFLFSYKTSARDYRSTLITKDRNGKLLVSIILNKVLKIPKKCLARLRYWMDFLLLCCVAYLNICCMSSLIFQEDFFSAKLCKCADNGCVGYFHIDCGVQMNRNDLRDGEGDSPESIDGNNK